MRSALMKSRYRVSDGLLYVEWPSRSAKAVQLKIKVNHASSSRSLKREILPDPKFGSVELSKFMNVIMESGKKAVAERIIYGALEQVERRLAKESLEVFT